MFTVNGIGSYCLQCVSFFLFFRSNNGKLLPCGPFFLDLLYSIAARNHQRKIFVRGTHTESHALLCPAFGYWIRMHHHHNIVPLWIYFRPYIFAPRSRFFLLFVSLMVCPALSYVHKYMWTIHTHTTTFCARCLSSGSSRVPASYSANQRHCQHSWFKNEKRNFVCDSDPIERAHVGDKTDCARRCL